MTDLRVTVTECAYTPPDPPAGHVRHTTERVVREAIRNAGTIVCEPIDRFTMEAPIESTSMVLGLLGRHRAIPEATRPGQSIVVITGTLPAAEVDAVRRSLHGASHGEGFMESRLDHYAPMRGTPLAGPATSDAGRADSSSTTDRRRSRRSSPRESARR